MAVPFNGRKQPVGKFSGELVDIVHQVSKNRSNSHGNPFFAIKTECRMDGFRRPQAKLLAGEPVSSVITLLSVIASELANEPAPVPHQAVDVHREVIDDADRTIVALAAVPDSDPMRAQPQAFR